MRPAVAPSEGGSGVEAVANQKKEIEMQPKSKPDKNVNVVIVWTKLNSCFYVNGGVESLFNHTVYLLIKICSFIDY